MGVKVILKPAHHFIVVVTASGIVHYCCISQLLFVEINKAYRNHFISDDAGGAVSVLSVHNLHRRTVDNDRLSKSEIEQRFDEKIEAVCIMRVRVVVIRINVINLDVFNMQRLHLLNLDIVLRQFQG